MTAADTPRTCPVGCDRCGRVWRVPATYLGQPTQAHFHYCRGGAVDPPRRRRERIADRSERDRGAVFVALLASLGDDVLLRPLEGNEVAP